MAFAALAVWQAAAASAYSGGRGSLPVLGATETACSLFDTTTGLLRAVSGMCNRNPELRVLINLFDAPHPRGHPDILRSPVVSSLDKLCGGAHSPYLVKRKQVPPLHSCVLGFTRVRVWTNG